MKRNQSLLEVEVEFLKDQVKALWEKLNVHPPEKAITTDTSSQTNPLFDRLKRKLIWKSDPAFWTRNILLTLRNSKTRAPVECSRDSAFERKSSPRDKRRREAGVSRGVRGHVPPENCEILYSGNAIFSTLMGKSKWFNCCIFKSIFCVKKNNYADN